MGQTSNGTNWSGFANAGAVAGQGIMGYFSAKQANRQNYKLAHEGMQHEIDMWNMQNAYNTPAAQMARLKEAGLNPNLMYGQGSVGNATQQPRAHIPQYNEELSKLQIPDALEIMKQLLDMKKVEQETVTGRYQAEFNEVLRNTALSKLVEDKILSSGSDAWFKHHRYGREALKETFEYETYEDRLKKLRADSELAKLNTQLARELKPYYMSVNDHALGKLSLWLYNNLDKWLPKVKNAFKDGKEQTKKVRKKVDFSLPKIDYSKHKKWIKKAYDYIPPFFDDSSSTRKYFKTKYNF